MRSVNVLQTIHYILYCAFCCCIYLSYIHQTLSDSHVKWSVRRARICSFAASHTARCIYKVVLLDGCVVVVVVSIRDKVASRESTRIHTHKQTYIYTKTYYNAIVVMQTGNIPSRSTIYYIYIIWNVSMCVFESLIVLSKFNNFAVRNIIIRVQSSRFSISNLFALW